MAGLDWGEESQQQEKEERSRRKSRSSRRPPSPPQLRRLADRGPRLPVVGLQDTGGRRNEVTTLWEESKTSDKTSIQTNVPDMKSFEGPKPIREAWPVCQSNQVIRQACSSSTPVCQAGLTTISPEYRRSLAGQSVCQVCLQNIRQVWQKWRLEGLMVGYRTLQRLSSRVVSQHTIFKFSFFSNCKIILSQI